MSRCPDVRFELRHTFQVTSERIFRAHQVIRPAAWPDVPHVGLPADVVPIIVTSGCAGAHVTRRLRSHRFHPRERRRVSVASGSGCEWVSRSMAHVHHTRTAGCPAQSLAGLDQIQLEQIRGSRAAFLSTSALRRPGYEIVLSSHLIVIVEPFLKFFSMCWGGPCRL